MLRVALVLSAVLIGLLAGPSASGDVVWTKVGTGIQQGISGITASSDGGWVVVRDNKIAGQNRVALLSDTNAVTQLAWPGTAPQDLEAIDSVPGQPGTYAVVTSAGAGRIITIKGTTLSVVRSFTLPVGKTQNEGFALTRLGTTTVAVWGNRGSASTPGRLFTATFNPSTGSFGANVKAAVTVPYPDTAFVRHISDTEVLGNRIVISSTSDPGNNGPFASALYDVGIVKLVSGRARLTLFAPSSLGTYDGHKIEGIACAGSSGVLGTDDENLGGYVTAAPFCG